MNLKITSQRSRCDNGISVYKRILGGDDTFLKQVIKRRDKRVCVCVIKLTTYNIVYTIHYTSLLQVPVYPFPIFLSSIRILYILYRILPIHLDLLCMMHLSLSGGPQPSLPSLSTCIFLSLPLLSLSIYIYIYINKCTAFSKGLLCKSCGVMQPL